MSEILSLHRHFGNQKVEVLLYLLNQIIINLIIHFIVRERC